MNVTVPFAISNRKYKCLNTNSNTYRTLDKVELITAVEFRNVKFCKTLIFD